MLESLITAFIVITLAEILDKTQLIVISLSSRYAKLQVFIGAFSALLTVTMISCIIGNIIFYYIPLLYIKLFSGSIFIIFGLLSIKNKQCEIIGSDQNVKKVSLSSFILTFLCELGDKTQLSVIILAAVYGNILWVFMGAAFGFLLITIISVMLGELVSIAFHSERRKYLDITTAIIFIVIGVTIIIEPLI
ncbi:MAG: TMEM165/GDT1 family protein [Candidatus Njordarchaeum guaymaensis]